MKSYPKYKDSGVEWLKDIPSHWEVKRVKHSVKLRTEQTEQMERYNLHVALENIESWTGRLLTPVTGYTGRGDLFWKGDVLFSKLRPYLAKVVLAKDDGVAIGELLIFKPNDILDSRYLFYRLLSSPFISLVDGSTYGTKMPRASWDFISNIKWTIPPLVEQHAISCFLDRKTKQIDTLVEKKRKQIEFLREQRTAIINEAVTKGLNPKVKMSESGVKWIGAIPEHWKLTKIGRVAVLGRGRVISHEEIGENPGNYPVYSSQTENDGIMGHISTYDFEGEYVTWTTDGANAGRAFFRRGTFNCTNVCGTMQAKDSNVYLPYLPYLLNLGTKYYVRYDINPKMMNGMMAQIDICFPPILEQKAIAAYLDKKTSDFDTMIAKEERLIDLLQEYRTSLISEVVTGKVDVRTEGAA